MLSSTPMPTAATESTHLRRATPRDLSGLASLWRSAWLDGHSGNVPDELMAARGLDHFTRFLGERCADTTIAVDQSRSPLGLIILDNCTGEVVQLAVARSARGTGVASRLLHAAERQLWQHGHTWAWLAVVPGNTRARAFYERHGWNDDGPMVHRAPTAEGGIDVPVRRYAKLLSNRAATMGQP